MAKASAKGPKLGRPSECTPELMEEICVRFSSGEPLIDIVKDSHMPPLPTIRGWLYKDRSGREGPWSGFDAMFARAREDFAELEAEEMRKIADNIVVGEVRTVRDIITKSGETKQLEEIRYGDMTEHRKLQIETRKWRASRMSPKNWGNNRKEQDDEDDESGTIKVVIKGGLTRA